MFGGQGLRSVMRAIISGMLTGSEMRWALDTEEARDAALPALITVRAPTTLAATIHRTFEVLVVIGRPPIHDGCHRAYAAGTL